MNLLAGSSTVYIVVIRRWRHIVPSDGFGVKRMRKPKSHNTQTCSYLVAAERDVFMELRYFGDWYDFAPPRAVEMARGVVARKD